MKKTIILLFSAAFLFSGCDQVKEKVAERKKKVTAAEEAAAQAQARFAARAEERAAGKASGKAGNAGAALAALLCTSPKLMEDIEGSMGLLDALGGEGGDPAEQKRQFLASRDHYRAILERELPARGASFAEFAVYAAEDSAAQKQNFHALVSGKCPRGDKDLVERTAGGLVHYFARQGRQ